MQVYDGIKAPLAPSSIDRTARSSDVRERPEGAAQDDFRKSLEKVQSLQPPERNFFQGLSASPGLKFSQHAVDRMVHRGIQLSPLEKARIEAAVQRAAQKGAKETLVLTDQSALIVSVKNNTVVTVMDKASLKENVFTNIDSTVVI